MTVEVGGTMNASVSLQTAIVQTMSEIPLLTGVFDGPPARARYPYLCVDCGSERSWNFSARAGREISVSLTVWDDEPARLTAVDDEIERRLAAEVDIAGWHRIDLHPLERSVTRDVDGPWASRLSLRARLIRRNGGTLS